MKRQHNDLGFTLLELMIALGISVIVLTGVMGIFSTNTQSYLLQEDVANMQENLRSAMVIMQREVQMAGAGMPGIEGDENGVGGFAVTKLIAGVLTQQRVFPLTFQNNAGDIAGLTADAATGIFPNGAGGHDRLTVRYNRMVEGSCGPVPQGITLKACDTLPKITLQEKMPSNSPEAKILELLAYNSGNKFPCDVPGSACYSMFPEWDKGCWCGESYPAPKMGFMAIITAPDGSKADIFQIDGVQGWPAGGSGATDASGHGAANKIQQKMKLANDYPDRSKITFFSMKTYREVMFYVQDNNLRQRVTIFNDPTADGDILAPTITDQPIAENIEDLQFAFQFANSTSWNNNADITGLQSLQVRLVRINILGRTSNPGNTFATHVSQAIGIGTGASAASLEDHAASDIESQEPIKQAGRYYSRKLIQTTVKVRALGL